MFKLFVGIDVSKDSFSATGINPKGNVCFSLSAAMDRGGFSELMNAITSNCKDLSAVLTGMESTGCYHINLFSFLSDKVANTVIINPLLISNFAKMSLRKTKTDKKDSLAKIGDISNFSSHKSLIAFAGLDPTVYQSGKFQGTSRISKRGNRHLRRLVYLMTIGVIRCNAFFKAYFLKRRKDGLPSRKAVMAAAHKLLRTIFAMLSHNLKFHVKEVNSL